MKNRWSCLIAATFCVLGVLESPLQAQEVSSPESSVEAGDPRLGEADERIRRGESLYASGDFDGALVEFQRAYQLLEGHPMQYLALYNIGRCQERLFQYGQAMESYRRYLQLAGPEVDGRAEVEATIRTLEGLLATIRLQVNVGGYEVWVDEQSIGSDLTVVMVPGGSHVVEIRAPGYVAAREQVIVPARTEQSLSFELEALAEEYRGLNQAYFWVSVGLAVATVAVGAVFGGLALSASGDVEERLDDERESWQVTQDDLDHITTLGIAADVLYGTAGLFAVAAIILGVFTDWGRDESSDPAVGSEARRPAAPTVSLGLGGFALEGRF